MRKIVTRGSYTQMKAITSLTESTGTTEESESPNLHESRSLKGNYRRHVQNSRLSRNFIEEIDSRLKFAALLRAGSHSPGPGATLRLRR